jgi:hypothetical protein
MPSRPSDYTVASPKGPAAAFRCCCTVIDDHRHAAVLTDRDSKSLSEEGRDRIKELGVTTSEPLRACIREGIATGVVRDVDPDLASSNMLLLAHAWADRARAEVHRCAPSTP